MSAAPVPSDLCYFPSNKVLGKADDVNWVISILPKVTAKAFKIGGMESAVDGVNSIFALASIFLIDTGAMKIQ